MGTLAGEITVMFAFVSLLKGSRLSLFRWPGASGRHMARLWSDCADAQADLSLRWSHKSYCKFCRAMAQIFFSFLHIMLCKTEIRQSFIWVSRLTRSHGISTAQYGTWRRLCYQVHKPRFMHINWNTGSKQLKYRFKDGKKSNIVYPSYCIPLYTSVFTAYYSVTGDKNCNYFKT